MESPEANFQILMPDELVERLRSPEASERAQDTRVRSGIYENCFSAWALYQYDITLPCF